MARGVRLVTRELRRWEVPDCLVLRVAELVDRSNAKGHERDQKAEVFEANATGLDEADHRWCRHPAGNQEVPKEEATACEGLISRERRGLQQPT